MWLQLDDESAARYAMPVSSLLRPSQSTESKQEVWVLKQDSDSNYLTPCSWIQDSPPPVLKLVTVCVVNRTGISKVLGDAAVTVRQNRELGLNLLL